MDFALLKSSKQDSGGLSTAAAIYELARIRMLKLTNGYHLRNFEFLLRFVTAEYGDLLNAAETDFAERFAALSMPARSLWVRMAMRRGPWFRADRLLYADVPDTEAALLELCLAGFACHAGTAAPVELLEQFSRHELEHGRLHLPRMRTKADLVQTLVEAGLTPARLGLTTPLVRCLEMDHLQVLRLLFFGNLRQDLTDFVLSELGIMRYEPYALTGRGHFESRLVVEELLAVEAWALRVDKLLERADPLELAEMGEELGAWSCGAQARRRRDDLMLRIARDLERLAAPEAALRLYCRTERASARERRTRLLYALGRRAEVVRECQAMLDAPVNEAEALFAARFSTRVLRGATSDLFEAALLRCAKPLVRRHRRKYDQRKLRLHKTDERVEERVRVWYETQGNRAFFVENALFPGLFGLAFWDIVFSELPGVFFHPFQLGPADLFTTEFRGQRADPIAERLAELRRDNTWRERVLFHYETRVGIACPFVDWRTLTPELLRLALERIPGVQVAQVCERILDDPAANRSGFPDLVVFPEASGYRLVEVKGPGDALQNNQKRWLQAFLDWEIPASVVDVSWQK